MNAFLMSDALDDLAADRATPVAPPPPTAAQRAWHANLARGRVMVEADAGFLAIVAPDLYLFRGSILANATILANFGRSAAQCQEPNYQAVPGARNALRHTLHATGVL